MGASKLQECIIQLNLLIKNAEFIYMATDPYEDYPLISYRNTLARYKRWSHYAHNFFNDYKSIVNLPLGFFEGDSINIFGLGLIPENQKVFSDPKEEMAESKTCRLNINSALGKQINALEEIRKNIDPRKTVRGSKSKNIIKFTFPDVKWERLVLKIKEGKEDIEIFYNGKYIRTASYVELGFSATKTNYRPNNEWNLLIALSVLQKVDITQATPIHLKAMLKNNTTKVDNVYQTKKLLSVALKDVFITDEDPFVLNKKHYEPKFIILPEPGLRSPDIWSTRLKNNESHEPSYLKDGVNEDLYSDESYDGEN